MSGRYVCMLMPLMSLLFFFFQAEDGIRDKLVTGVQTCALPISPGTGLITRQLIPSLTMWQSEWVFLRAQYQWAKQAAAPATHLFALQAVWAIGPHKHETY